MVCGGLYTLVFLRFNFCMTLALAEDFPEEDDTPNPTLPDDIASLKTLPSAARQASAAMWSCQSLIAAGVAISPVPVVSRYLRPSRIVISPSI